MPNQDQLWSPFASDDPFVPDNIAGALEYCRGTLDVLRGVLAILISNDVLDASRVESLQENMSRLIDYWCSPAHENRIRALPPAIIRDALAEMIRVKRELVADLHLRPTTRGKEN